jgi:hypothetical protein
LGALLGILFFAALLRGWAALRLPLDYDEPVYLQAGLDYARALRAGDWNGVIDYAENREHPALAKVLYAVPLLVLGPEVRWLVALYASRFLSALLGTLAALLLALFDPLAGVFLGAHTLAVKYTSQAYLEALPHLASLAAVLVFLRSASRRDGWFWLSAVALGITAAAKFTYLPVVLVLLYLAIFEKRLRWHDLVLFVAVSVVAFWLFNPSLWHEPVGRLLDSLFFHVRYSQGPRVELAGLPWYQPLYWISRSAPSAWHPEVFFYWALDSAIFLLAMAGLYWEWRERRWVVVWIVTSLLFLLVWPTKWPQYSLVLVPALCLSASQTVRQAHGWLREQETYWQWFREMVPRPPLAFWIILAALVAAITVGYTASSLQMTLGRLYWTQLNRENSLLPSNTVYAILRGPEEQMVLGTERGVALWYPPAATDLPDRWILYHTGNSPLPHNSVRSLAYDAAGHLWAGTEQGLAVYDGSGWQIYHARDLGLAADAADGEVVYALAVGSDGRLWVGTGSGAAVLIGQAWTPFTAATSGLVHNRVLSLAVEPRPAGDRVWFGTRAGLSRLDTTTGEWSSFPQDFDPAWGGVIELTLDASGRLWAGTLGGGLGLWQGPAAEEAAAAEGDSAWRFYRTANSDLPFNTVTLVAELRPGVLWVGTALPAQAGGQLAEFDGREWKIWTDRNSGFSGAEPLALAQAADGRWWLGTRTAGVDIYTAPERGE